MIPDQYHPTSSPPIKQDCQSHVILFKDQNFNLLSNQIIKFEGEKKNITTTTTYAIHRSAMQLISGANNESTNGLSLVDANGYPQLGCLSPF